MLAVSDTTSLVDAQHIVVTDPAGSSDPYYNLCAVVIPLDREVSCGMIPEVSRTAATTTLEISPWFFTNDPLTKHDCRTIVCQIVDFPSGGAATASVPVTFDAVAPLRSSPVLDVSPNTGLVDGQTVAVSQAPPFPGSASFGECAAPTVDIFVLHEPCETITDDLGIAPYHGQVHAFVETHNGPVDCRAPGATCVMEGLDSIFRPVDTSISFAPDGALDPRAVRRPTLETTAGVYRTNTLDAMGFAAGDGLTVRWCVPLGGPCGDSVIATRTSDSSGLATFDIGPHPTSSATDKAVCASGCFLTVLGAAGARAAVEDYSWTLGSFPAIPVGGPIGGGTTTTTANRTVSTTTASQPATAVAAQPSYTG